MGNCENVRSGTRVQGEGKVQRFCKSKSKSKILDATQYEREITQSWTEGTRIVQVLYVRRGHVRVTVFFLFVVRVRVRVRKETAKL